MPNKELTIEEIERLYKVIGERYRLWGKWWYDQESYSDFELFVKYYLKKHDITCTRGGYFG